MIDNKKISLLLIYAIDELRSFYNAVLFILLFVLIGFFAVAGMYLIIFGNIIFRILYIAAGVSVFCGLFVLTRNMKHLMQKITVYKMYIAGEK